MCAAGMHSRFGCLARAATIAVVAGGPTVLTVPAKELLFVTVLIIWLTPLTALCLGPRCRHEVSCARMRCLL